MVICIAALVVLAFLGIFSAKYRKWAKEAFSCVGRKLTLRPCESSFDQKVRASSVAWLMKRNQKAAKFVYKRFEFLSWIFMIAFVISIILVVGGVYNYWAYGNCNGPDSSGFCVFNALAGEASPTGNPADLSPPESLYGISFGNPDAEVKVVEFGCFTCPYTKKAEAFVKPIIDQYGDRIQFVFKPFPLPIHGNSWATAMASMCADDQGKYWDYRARLFSAQSACASDSGNETIYLLAEASGMDMRKFKSCLLSGKYYGFVEQTFQEGKSIGIYGTPTFFVNGRPVVGPDEQGLRNLIEQELAKAAK